MSRRVIIRSIAETDLSEIYHWYESTSPGLGTRFLTSFEAGISLLARLPEMAPLIHLEYRRLLITKFPYGIFYVSRPTFLSVGAVFHLSRDPSWIRRQLEKRQ